MNNYNHRVTEAQRNKYFLSVSVPLWFKYCVGLYQSAGLSIKPCFLVVLHCLQKGHVGPFLYSVIKPPFTGGEVGEVPLGIARQVRLV